MTIYIFTENNYVLEQKFTKIAIYWACVNCRAGIGDLFARTNCMKFTASVIFADTNSNIDCYSS